MTRIKVSEHQQNSILFVFSKPVAMCSHEISGALLNQVGTSFDGLRQAHFKRGLRFVIDLAMRILHGSNMMDGMGNATMGEEAALSGAFAGHFIAASIFAGFGCLLLGLVLKRSLASPSIYAEKYIPEPDSLILFRIGMFLMIACPLGIVGEALSGYIVKDDWFFQSGHEVLYFTFFFSGVVSFLESLGKLPPDSVRCGIAVSLLAAYLQWNAHANMKANSADQELHSLLAHTSLVNAIVMAWSVHQGKKSMIAYLLSFALLLLQGLWLYTAAFNLGVGNSHSDSGGLLTMDNVTLIFCVELLFVGFAIVFATAFVRSVHEKGEQRDDKEVIHAKVLGQSEYEHLRTTDLEK